MALVVSLPATSTINEDQSKSDIVLVNSDIGRKRWAFWPKGFETHACSIPAASVTIFASGEFIEPAGVDVFTVGALSTQRKTNPFAVVADITDRTITPKEVILTSLAFVDIKAVLPTELHAAAPLKSSTTLVAVL
jgi:hypothetical protein